MSAPLASQILWAELVLRRKIQPLGGIISLPQPPVFTAQLPPTDTRGLGAGVTSIVCSAMVLLSMCVTVPVSHFAALFTRPDTGSGTLNWVAPAVFWSLPALFGLIGVILGIVAVARSQRDSPGQITGVIGLSVLGLEIGGSLTLMANRGTVMSFF